MKDLTKYKHYEGGVTTSGVGAETGFAFTRRRLGCYCVPAAGESCSHVDWTGADASARDRLCGQRGPFVLVNVQCAVTF